MPAVFAVVVAFLVNAFRVVMANQLGRWIVSALVFLGITYGTQKVVMGPALDQISQMMAQTQAGDFAIAARKWAGVLQLDTAVSMILGTIATKRGLKNAKFALYASRIPVGAPR